MSVAVACEWQLSSWWDKRGISSFAVSVVRLNSFVFQGKLKLVNQAWKNLSHDEKQVGIEASDCTCVLEARSRDGGLKDCLVSSHMA